MTPTARRQYTREFLLAGREIPFAMSQDVAAYLMQQVSDSHLARLRTRAETGEAYPNGTERSGLVEQGKVKPLPCPYTIGMNI